MFGMCRLPLNNTQFWFRCWEFCSLTLSSCVQPALTTPRGMDLCVWAGRCWGPWQWWAQQVAVFLWNRCPGGVFVGAIWRERCLLDRDVKDTSVTRSPELLGCVRWGYDIATLARNGWWHFAFRSSSGNPCRMLWRSAHFALSWCVAVLCKEKLLFCQRWMKCFILVWEVPREVCVQRCSRSVEIKWLSSTASRGKLVPLPKARSWQQFSSVIGI